MPVNRDLERVPGRVSVLPGNTVVQFFPDRDLAYGASVLVNVLGQGEELARLTYAVRELPTLLAGHVADSFGEALAGIEVELPELGLSSVSDADGGYTFGFGTTVQLPGGRHRLLFNPGFQQPHLGIVEQWAVLDEGRFNRIGVTKLPILNRDVPFQHINGGVPRIELAGGDLVLNLSDARLLFPDRRTAGNLHVQFMSPDQLAAPSLPSTVPL